MNYSDFLASKHVRVQFTGHDIAPEKLCPSLKDFQRASVHYGLRLGRFGCYQGCGLGKTIQELAFAEALILGGFAKRALLLAPPAVSHQTKAEADKFGIRVEVRVVRDQSQVDSGINITNYERLHLIDPSAFDIVVLDEASILKNFMGKTKQALLQAFANTPYRKAATATPAPNDYMEFGNQADFLGIMRANEMLSRWFINDSMSAGNYRLKGHAADDFWAWMASWSTAANKPSDLGDFSDEGYILPELRIHDVLIGEECVLRRQEKISATAVHKVKRERAGEWADKVAEITRGDKSSPWVCWCETNYEADELIRAMPDAVEIRGSHKLEEKEERLIAFAKGEIEKLITKPEIAGFGMNWQHSCNSTYPASYSYEKFYQAICRQLRFGQTRTVNAYIVMTPEELSLEDSRQSKAALHKEMQNKMGESMKHFQQENLQGKRSLRLTSTPIDARTYLPAKSEYDALRSNPDWQLWHGDCVDVARSIPDDSVDFCITSPPFSNLYIYSDSVADMGNARDHREFFNHYKYLIAEQYRITTPGRLCAIHCKDLPLYKGRDGAMGLYPFPCDIVTAFLECGWVYHSHVTIWKDPVTEMQRTKNHGLLHRQLCRDSSTSRQGMADYLLVFRKWPADDVFPNPVTSGNDYCRFNRYVGESGPAEHITPLEDLACKLDAPHQYSIQVWQRYASPVWFDIRQMRVLNYKLGTTDKDEKHICPLQLDVVERSIELWTNPGDRVYDPFNGIGTTGAVALEMGRKYYGSELKDSYVRISLDNYADALRKRADAAKSKPRMLPMFDSETEPHVATAI